MRAIQYCIEVVSFLPVTNYGVREQGVPGRFNNVYGNAEHQGVSFSSGTSNHQGQHVDHRHQRHHQQLYHQQGNPHDRQQPHRH